MDVLGEWMWTFSNVSSNWDCRFSRSSLSVFRLSAAVPLTKRDGGSVMAVDCEPEPEDWVSIEVVSDEALVVLPEDSRSGTVVELRS